MFDEVIDILIDEPFEEYLKQSATNLSSHKLARFANCPREYMLNEPFKETPSMKLGTAIHTRLLYGYEQFMREYTWDSPINEKTDKPYGTQTKAYAEWAELCGQIVLTPGEAKTIGNVSYYANQSSDLNNLLFAGKTEGVLRTEYARRPCQIRIDFTSYEHGIVDLKSTADINWFISDAYKYNYLMQMGFYRAVVREATGLTLPVHLCAIETKPPYRVGCWLISPSKLDQQEVRILELIDFLEHCEAANEWPTGYEGIRIL